MDHSQTEGNRMTLKQKRAEWEKGLMPQLVVSEV